MAKGMRDIKRQIKSTQNMKQITKAMEMIAASNLRKAQQNAEAARPYSEKIREVIASVAAGSKNMKHPMMQSREVRKTGYLVISSDRGLAGGFNANLLRGIQATLRQKHKSTDEYAIFVVGRKGRDFFRKRGMPVVGEVTNLPDAPRFSDLAQLAKQAVGNFETGAYDELYLVYNEFVNPLVQRPVESRLLPLAAIEGGTAGPSANYEYEPSPEAVLETLLPRYAETLIFSAVLESKASEFSARMNAMSNASRNATELIAKYTLQYNRARQASITQEISEIVAGANSQS